MRVDDIVISSVDRISVFDGTAGEYLFDLGELTEAAIEEERLKNGQEEDIDRPCGEGNSHGQGEGGQHINGDTYRGN